MNKSFWQTVPPQVHRLSRARLDTLRDGLATKGTKSLLIIRNDAIVYEWYASGHGPDKPHYTASLAKALVGGLSLLLALQDGLIEIDDLAQEYIPAWRDDPLKSKITIRHLATHTSGIENSELSQADREQALAEERTLTDHHMSLPGWKGAFWRREPDPFSVAIQQAPIIFQPGTDYAYSNPGMAALAYAVTAALQKSPWQDIRSLLKDRIMDPLGISDDAWRIGYNQAYEVDGLSLWANWGGGNWTARAVAAVGQLLLHRGQWKGKQLLDPAWLKQMLKYAGMPLPPRPQGNPQPGSGLCWYTNFDGVWPTLPRDAFAGGGAGNQHLLVLPCRNLVMVRNGSQLGDPDKGKGFWGSAEKHLFTPLFDCFLDRLPGDTDCAPYPASSTIKNVEWAPPSTIIRKAFDSDNWPITWGNDAPQGDGDARKDGVLYTAYGDGRGFQPYTEKKIGLGFARIAGPAEHFQAANIRSPSGENEGMGPNGIKASGMLMVNDVLYMWGRNAGNARLAWSNDRGRTWTWSNWKFAISFGHPTFLNYGRNYASARDEYVYVFSHDADSAYEPADRMVLARVHQDRIHERDAYEFFVQIGDAGQPVWSADIDRRGAVFEYPGLCRRSGISYNAGLKRYLWWQHRAETDVDTRFQGGFGIYDAPEPWGPWHTAYFTLEWDCGPGEMGSFPTKWMSTDGRTCYLVFSGNDYFSVRKAIFSTEQTRNEDR